jgi:hypothetical protein
MFGKWNINVDVNGMPQKVATAVAGLSEKLVGAEYSPIAYLGSQVVNGINHAVLAEQLLITGKDTKNVVILIFNERGNDITLANIERVIEAGEELGGTNVNVVTEIPEDAMKAFEKVLGGFVGATVRPFALLATQVTKGVNYIFVAEITPVVVDPEKKVAIVTVNELENKASFADVLKSGLEVSLGKPLGEWP